MNIGKIRYITIHCAATRPASNVTAADVTEWHKARGWRTIGYHYFIRRDGTLENGRALDELGAHVGGHNTGNIGICMAGGVKQADGKTPEDNFTPEQWGTLRTLMESLHARYPEALIMGHNGFPEHETRGCPCFDWRKWRKDFLDSLKEPEPVFDGHWVEEVDTTPTVY